MPDNIDLRCYKTSVEEYLFQGAISKKDIFLNIGLEIEPDFPFKDFARKFHELHKKGYYKKLFDFINELYNKKLSSNLVWQFENDNHPLIDTFEYLCTLNGHWFDDGKTFLMGLF